MLEGVLRPVENELEQVQLLLSKSFKIKAGHLKNYAHLTFDEVNSVIRPLVLLLSARLYGNINARLVALAAVAQFIFMASSVHKGINEDNDSIYNEENPDPRDGCQFPVLVGDYLYGKFFTSLCDAEIVQYLRPLSEIICKINQGGILRLKHDQRNNVSQEIINEMVSLETAELFAGCARLGGALAGAGEQQREILHQFGHNLGMAFGLTERKAPSGEIELYLTSALDYITLLPNKQERANLEALMKYFLSHDRGLRQMVG